MEDPSLSSVPVAERAWPNLRTFAALSPPPDFTHGTLDPANQFSQFMRHVVRQLQMCGLYTDEDVLRWLVVGVIIYTSVVMLKSGATN